MIRITKEEASAIRDRYPSACIVRTRHKRYLEEDMRYLSMIPNNVEAAAIVETNRARKERKKKFMNKMKKRQQREENRYGY